MFFNYQEKHEKADNAYHDKIHALTPAGKVANQLSTCNLLKFAERSETKIAKRGFTLNI